MPGTCREYTARQAKPAVRILTLTSHAFVTPVQSGKSIISGTEHHLYISARAAKLPDYLFTGATNYLLIFSNNVKSF